MFARLIAAFRSPATPVNSLDGGAVTAGCATAIAPRGMTVAEQLGVTVLRSNA